jgi:aminobenzoyl-glutamate transport protein
MLTEITNEAIVLAGGEPLTLAANYFFMVGSSFILAIVATVVTTRIIEPRLGPYQPEGGAASAEGDDGTLSAAESRGLRWAGLATLAVIALVALLTIPSGAPLRMPEGQVGGNSPLMDSLLFIITMAFLIAGVAYGRGAGTMTTSGEVIAAVTKTFAGLAGLLFMLLMISQFIAYFNYSNMPTVLAISMADLLERANIGALPLLLGMIVVIILLDVIIPGSMPKWAIFAPVFVPIFFRLGVAPQTVLAAYRVGDSPVNIITPIMAYFPLIVVFAARYDRRSGIGTVIALMLPYAILLMVLWTLFFVLWYLIGIPLGPGAPV